MEGVNFFVLQGIWSGKSEPAGFINPAGMWEGSLRLLLAGIAFHLICPVMKVQIFRTLDSPQNRQPSEE